MTGEGIKLLTASTKYQVNCKGDEADQPEILNDPLKSLWSRKSLELTRVWPTRVGLSHNSVGKGGISRNNMT